MAKKVKFKLNSQGVRDLLQSNEMQGVLRNVASQKAQQAGEGYESDVKLGKKRAYANIFPASAGAAADNFDNNTLEKVIRS